MSLKESYRKLGRKKQGYLLICALLLVVLFFGNMGVGTTSISLGEVAKGLFGSLEDEGKVLIIRSLRLPMALMALGVGFGLGLGGSTIQTLLRNPIASPQTLGITSAASFGAALGLLSFHHQDMVQGNLLVTLSAFLWTMAAAGLLFRLSRIPRIGKQGIILFGVAINFFFQSLTMFLQYIADEDELANLVFWTFGSMLKANLWKVGIVFSIFVPVFVYLYRRSWELTAMTLDDNQAKRLGVDVEKLRRIGILLISLLVAVSVCFVGTVAFVGLIAPHMARFMVGEDQRYFLPLSTLLGGVITSMAFLMSKWILPGVVLPIGLITSVIGIPFFVAGLWKNRGRLRT